jgi:transposase
MAGGCPPVVTEVCCDQAEVGQTEEDVEQYVGLDVSLAQTSICVVDGSGRTLWQGKCASTPEAIAAAIRAKAPEVARVGLESGPLSAWHWDELKKLGLPVICLDARHAKAALSLQLNKSDRNDARGLAQIVRTGGHARSWSRAWTASWSALC